MMMSKVIFIGLTYLVMTEHSAISQSLYTDTVMVFAGDGTVTGKGFFNYENIWEMTEVEETGASLSIGLWYDTLRVDTKTGTLIRRQYVKYTNGHIRQHYDKVYTATLLPIHTKVIGQDRAKAKENIITDIQYSNKSFSGARRFAIQGEGPDGSMIVTTSMQLEKPVFDWHLWGILVSGFPLKENYAARFLTHTSTATTDSPFLWITLKVTGSEMVKSKKWGNADCWVVHVQAEVPWTFWISKNLTVAPIQMIKIDETGMGGSISWWKPKND